MRGIITRIAVEHATVCAAEAHSYVLQIVVEMDADIVLNLRSVAVMLKTVYPCTYENGQCTIMNASPCLAVPSEDATVLLARECFALHCTCC